MKVKVIQVTGGQRKVTEISGLRFKKVTVMMEYMTMPVGDNVPALAISSHACRWRGRPARSRSA